MKCFRNIGSRFFLLLYIVAFSIVVVMVLFDMGVEKGIVALLFLPVLAGVIWGYKKADFSGRIPFPFLWWILFFSSLILIPVIAYSARVELTWEYGKLILQAAEFVSTGEIADKSYLARYPNNQLWFCCLVVLFQGVRLVAPQAGIIQFHMVSIAFSCLCIWLSILLIYLSAVCLWGKRGGAITGIISLFCVPFYMYATFAYTDTSGMLIVALMVFLFIRYRMCTEWKQYILAAGIGALAAFSWYLKVTTFIVFIAILIAMLLQGRRWRVTVFSLLAVVTFLAGGHYILECGISSYIEISEEEYAQNRFPMSHWIMMSLDYGGYNQEDVEFTKSFPDYEEKNEADKEEIARRLRERTLSENIWFFFHTKQMRTWSDSTFGGSGYLARNPQFPDGFFVNLLSETGRYHDSILIWTNLYYEILLVGMLLSAFLAWNKFLLRQRLFFGRVALLGIFVLMTIWECNARYLVVFLPVLILVAVDGYLGVISTKYKG